MSDVPPVFRYASHRAGFLVLIAVALFATAVLQAGVLKNLFKSVSVLYVMLPEEGVSGLNVGANVEVLGTNAGRVKQVVVDPEQSFHAVVEIERSMQDFIRRDSRVLIRKQFGIAGASFLEISRGRGEPLDWDYAVLEAQSDRAATDSIGDLLADLQQRVYPILDETQRAVTTLANIIERIDKGEGSIGRITRDDGLSKELEGIAASIHGEVEKLGAVTDNLTATTASTAKLGNVLAQRIPAVLNNVNATIASLNTVVRDLGQRVPQATETLPSLLMQTQQTLAEMEQLMAQMRSSWILGGGGAPMPQSTRLPATEARP